MQPTLHREESQPVFILFLVVLSLIALGQMVEPFVGIILMALLIYVLCRPLYLRLIRWLPKNSPTFHAALITGMIFLFILTPLLVLSWTALGQAREIGPAIRKWNHTLHALQDGQLTAQMGWFKPIRGKIAEFLGMSSWDVQTWLIENLRPWIEQMDSFFVRLASNALSAFVGLFFFLLIIFYLFRDGQTYYSRLRVLLPLEMEYQDRLFQRIHYSLQVIIRGWFLSALIQGGVATVGYMIANLPGAMLLGFITALASVIPYVGTALVWVPAGLALLVQDELGRALFLLAWGGCMVGLIDNLAAPLLMGQQIKMPLPFLLLAILGGISLFGFKGLLLGPLILFVAPTLFEIYRERFLARSERRNH
jgi:predicted PurR-regulated permease PerM